MRRSGGLAPRRFGSRPDHGWPLGEELRAGQERHQRLGEEEHHDDVEHGGQTQREREALDLADGDDEQHRGGEERHEVGDQDGAPGARPGALDGRAQRAALADLVPDAFEVHDERVRRDTDRDDRTADRRQVQREADGRAEQRHDRVGQDRRRPARLSDGDERQAAVVGHQVDDDQGEADGAGDQAGLQLLAAERGGDGGDADLLEGERERAVRQHVGQVLRRTAG